ncbi:tRNA ligase, partial [Friedmanniomyces endolithicus]
MNNYSVDIKHEINGRNNNQQRNGTNSQQSNAKQKERKVDYFAVQVPPTRITTVLDAMFRDAPPETAQMYNTLKQQRRLQTEYHVTLVHRAMSGQQGKPAELWNELSDRHAKAAAPTPERP